MFAGLGPGRPSRVSAAEAPLPTSGRVWLVSRKPREGFCSGGLREGPGHQGRRGKLCRKAWRKSQQDELGGGRGGRGGGTRAPGKGTG